MWMHAEWQACQQCAGAVLGSGTFCLRHLAPAERADTLRDCDGIVDARAVQLTPDLLAETLEAICSVSPGSRFRLRLDWATLSGPADFSAVGHIGEISCLGTRFAGPAIFRGVVLEARAFFRGAQFTERADFTSAHFKRACTFRLAAFFEGSSFESAQFGGTAIFEDTAFLDSTTFRDVRFWDDASFVRSRFRAAADFRSTRFARDVRFRDSRFEGGAPVTDLLDRFSEGWWPAREASPQVEASSSTASVHVPSPRVNRPPSPVPRRPTVFIGSSTEGLRVALALQEILSAEVLVTVWNQGVFDASSYLLESLRDALAASDFAIFVATPDDLTLRRGLEHETARDNVVFEIGMFVGSIGRRRTYVVQPAGVVGHLPTDLAGIVHADYNVPDFEVNQTAALGAAASKILRSIRKLGPRENRDTLPTSVRNDKGSGADGT